MSRFIPHPARRPAVVTGPSSGIGLATARALAPRGHPEVLGARRLARCEESALAIGKGGGEAQPCDLDLANRGSIASFVESAVDAVGPIDILVSCAGQN